MNPIEQIWTEIRKRGFKNVLFQSLDTVVSKLCDVVNSLEASTVAHITSRKWMPFV
jgi:putative transposase